MFISRKAEGVSGQRKFGKSWFTSSNYVFIVG